MSKTVGAAIALLAVLSWLGGCGESDTGSEDPAPASASASALTISCTDEATAVDETSVSAGASGLSVRVVDNSESGLVALMESEITGVGAYVEANDTTVEVGPGRYAVRCVDLNEPEHMERATGNPGSRHVEVLASSDVWTPQHDPSCDKRMSSVRDYAAMPEADPQLRTEPVDPVVRNDREIARWILADDELVTTGYRDSEGRRVEVVRGGTVVGVITLSLGPEGWFIGSTEACATR